MLLSVTKRYKALQMLYDPSKIIHMLTASAELVSHHKKFQRLIAPAELVSEGDILGAKKKGTGVPLLVS